MRLSIEDLKNQTKDVSLVENMEFIKGGEEEYCHNCYGKECKPAPGATTQY